MAQYACCIARKGKFDEAWQILHDVSQKIRDNYTEYSAQYADLLMSMANVHLAQGSLEKFTQTLQQALHVCEEVYKDDPITLEYWKAVLCLCINA